MVYSTSRLKEVLDCEYTTPEIKLDSASFDIYNNTGGIRKFPGLHIITTYLFLTEATVEPFRKGAKGWMKIASQGYVPTSSVPGDDD